MGCAVPGPGDLGDKATRARLAARLLRPGLESLAGEDAAAARQAFALLLTQEVNPDKDWDVRFLIFLPQR